MRFEVGDDASYTKPDPISLASGVLRQGNVYRVNAVGFATGCIRLDGFSQYFDPKQFDYVPPAPAAPELDLDYDDEEGEESTVIDERRELFAAVALHALISKFPAFLGGDADKPKLDNIQAVLSLAAVQYADKVIDVLDSQ